MKNFYNITPTEYAEKENPMQTMGFAFVEFSSPDKAKLEEQIKAMGFAPNLKHNSMDITLYQQGEINFFLNFDKTTHAANFTKQHGSSAVAMGFKVKDANFAYERALELGATPYHGENETKTFSLPAIYGIGGSLLYFVDDNNSQQIFGNDFVKLPSYQEKPKGVGLEILDHLTHNLHQGNMDKWYNFYKSLFNFREIRYFDIKGKLTGLVSRALTSPCGNIKIPLNESKDDKSQIEEYLKEFNGEGIQHIALTAKDIYQTIPKMRNNGINFLDTPDTYYEFIDKRIPKHGENIKLMQENKILIDGSIENHQGILLQIFTENMLGPVFFEIIQRKENEGFGEGNFTALFESIELDQIRRGVLEDKK